MSRPVGTLIETVIFHRTALRLYGVSYADVATSRHSSNKFGSALDLRNVTKGFTPSG